MKSSAVTKILIEETNNLSEEQKLFNKLVKQIGCISLNPRSLIP